MKSVNIVLFYVFYFLLTHLLSAQELEPIRFNTNFPGAAIGKIEALETDSFRCFVDGQYNQYGRNRQPTWFYFRIDGGQGRKITIALTNFDGEYNNHRASQVLNRDCPVFSYDNVNWQLFPEAKWNQETKELVFSFTPKGNSIWIAYTPPYVPEQADRFYKEIENSPRTLVEVIGKSLKQNDIKMVTITDFNVPDVEKRHVWVVARLHAWEAMTSYIAEGLVRFLLDSNSSIANEICKKTIVRVVLMPDPDGCDRGMIRYNLNGFDLNRSWHKIDIRSAESLKNRPEVWYLKKAILSANALKPIDVVLNLHDHQTGFDLLETSGDGEEYLCWYRQFRDKMENPPLFKTHPKQRERIFTSRQIQDFGSMDEIWAEYGIRHILIEYNINKKEGTEYFLNLKDCYTNGANLAKAMFEAYQETTSKK